MLRQTMASEVCVLSGVEIGPETIRSSPLTPIHVVDIAEVMHQIVSPECDCPVH